MTKKSGAFMLGILAMTAIASAAGQEKEQAGARVSLTKEEKEILANREILENLELLRNLEKCRLLDLFIENPVKQKDPEKTQSGKEEPKKK